MPNFNAQQFPLNQQQLLLNIQQQNKILAQQQHQSNIAALVGGGMGVAPDVIINSSEKYEQSSVSVGSSTISNCSLQNNVTPFDNVSVVSSPLMISTTSQQQKQSVIANFECNTNSSVTSNLKTRIKKRLLDSMNQENENNNYNVAVADSNQSELVTKIAKIVNFINIFFITLLI